MKSVMLSGSHIAFRFLRKRNPRDSREVPISLKSNLLLAKGTSYDLEASVLFNGASFPCDLNVEVENLHVAEYDKEEGAIKAIGKGTTAVTLSTEWQGFEGVLLTREITLNVISDLTAETSFTVNGVSTATTSAELYLTDEWFGSSFPNSAVLSVTPYSGTVALTDCTVLINTDDGELITYNDGSGEITVNKNGKTSMATITVTVMNEDDDPIVFPVTVDVVSPVADYTGFFELSVIDGPYGTTWAQAFGKPAGSEVEIVAVSQEGRAINVSNGKIDEKYANLVLNGKETAPIEVQTTEGTLRFTDLNVYTRVITSGNAISTLKLNGINRGYFILKDDVGINASVDMQGQVQCYSNTYFGGTLPYTNYNPFIYRYDSAEQLRTAHPKLTHVGNWTLNGVWDSGSD